MLITLNGTSIPEFKNIKNEARDFLEKAGLPGSKNEEYKYTHLTTALEKHFELTPHSPFVNLDKNVVNSFSIPDLDAYTLVFVNGKFNSSLSKIPGNNLEFIFSSIFEAHHLYKPFQKHFNQYAGSTEDAFVALNTVVFNEGIYLEIPDNREVQKPILLLYLYSPEGKKTEVFPRNLIITGKNSHATIIELHQVLGDAPVFTNVVSEIVSGENSHLNYFKIQTENTNHYLIDSSYFYQPAYCKTHAYTFSFGGAMVRNNLNSIIDASGCESNLYGLTLLKGKHHVDHHTTVDHRKPHSESNELYKGVYDDEAVGVFNGKIYVRPDAQKTNAFQSNKSIVMTDMASVFTKPQLEIWADDVKCSHGATVGQLDEEQLFYIRSRGISEETAKAMLLHGFASEILEDIHIIELKKYLESLIDKAMGIH